MHIQTTLQWFIFSTGRGSISTRFRFFLFCIKVENFFRKMPEPPPPLIRAISPGKPRGPLLECSRNGEANAAGVRLPDQHGRRVGGAPAHGRHPRRRPRPLHRLCAAIVLLEVWYEIGKGHPVLSNLWLGASQCCLEMPFVHCTHRCAMLFQNSNPFYDIWSWIGLLVAVRWVEVAFSLPNYPW